MPPNPNSRESEFIPTIIDIRHYSSTQPQSTSTCSSETTTPHAQNNGESRSADPSAEKEDSTASPVRTTDAAVEAKESCVSSEGAAEGALNLGSLIIKGLGVPRGQPKSIPTVVLYDDKGLQIYDRITYLEEYYLVQEEINILVADSHNIVEHIPDNSVVVELGSGSLRKTAVLLDALERRRKNIQYFALDLMRDELTKSLLSLGGYKNVTTAGLWGTYEEAMGFLRSFPPSIPKTILWLGSSIGNLTRKEAKEFISAYRDVLNVGDSWLIGIDRRNLPKDITLAYNDRSSVTREFIMNGLDHVNAILGQEFLDAKKFEYFGRYNEELGRHEAYYKALQSHTLHYKARNGGTTTIEVEENELINVEYSYKWSLEESARLFQETEMTRVGQWASPSKRYDLHMLRKVPFYFSSTLSPPSRLRAAMPSIEEWEELWKAWNVVTIEMIKNGNLLMEQPIDLRHPFLFYLGHIPTFLDIQLAKAVGEPCTAPLYFTEIFERGIDPDVEDPTQCHQHSKVPAKWPDVEDILTYRDLVYARLKRVLENDDKCPKTRRLARILFIAFEHQAMHLETILYMLIQTTAPPPPPRLIPFSSTDAAPSKGLSNLSAATWIKIRPEMLDNEILSLGLNDVESEDKIDALNLSSPFGWDNEKPSVRYETPPSFQIQSRQVTNAEFLSFLQSTTHPGGEMKVPKSWTRDNDSATLRVRSIYGPISFVLAKDWPVACSHVEALAYARWLDPPGNSFSLPTEHQLSIAFKLKEASTEGLMYCNYGFKVWHPLGTIAEHPLTNAHFSTFQGPGGLWDWTATLFTPLGRDFVPSEIYPSYSADFFDQKHFVVLGASWATHPRIAERRSFRNWYQATYEYVLAGFRLVKNNV